MSLSRAFTLAAATLMTLVALMAALLCTDEWRRLRSAQDGLDAMGVARLALVVAEKASFERGPTNGVLGDADRRDPAKVQRLAGARATTDSAIATLVAALEGDARPAYREAAGSTTDVRRTLAAARAGVDRIAREPKRARAPHVMTAVRGMFEVIPPAMQGAATLSRVAEDAYPQFADMLVAARLAAELREYAGRLGSQYTGALAGSVPLTDDQRLAIAGLRGRIDELHHLITLRTTAQATSERIVVAQDAMEMQYFRTGLELAAAVERASLTGAAYGMDTAQFAARYVPPMGSIVVLRDTLLDVATAGARHARAQALRGLTFALAAATAALILVGVLIAIVRRRVVQPLLVATHAIVEIAQGRLDTPLPAGSPNDEVGRMFGAIATLRATSAEKDRLEGERRRLFEELRQLSTTDYLTGLPNRRAFADAAHVHIANAQRHRLPFAVVMFDLDHFKDVNDRYGHEAGDAVLKEIARIANAEFRDGDIVARHGGEEFVAIALHCRRSALAALAERVRVAVAAGSVRLADGSTVRVTSSFGAAVCDDGSGDLETMLRLADRALYAAKAGGRNRVEISEIDAASASPAP